MRVVHACYESAPSQCCAPGPSPVCTRSSSEARLWTMSLSPNGSIHELRYRPCLLRRKHRSSTSQRTGSCSPACTRTIVELIQPAVPDGEFQQAGKLLSLVGAGGGRRPVSAVRRRRVGGTQPTILRLLLAPVRAVSQPCAGPTPREHRGIDHSAFGVTSTHRLRCDQHIALRCDQHMAFSATSASGRCHSLSSGVNRSVSTAASRTTSSLQRMGSIRPVRHISVWSP